ncbi:MAG: CPBP family intramembrane metalloprotease, partial [Methanobrevibacter millerae]
TLVLFIPALYISTRLIYKTSFSSQLTFGRKWNWKLYIISAAITLAVYVIYFLAMGAASEMNLSKVSAISILLFIILPIFQAFAEEYLFRGFLMQTLGSWFKIPIVAVIIQAVIFGIIHFQYNVTGMIGVLVSGIIYGFVTWYTKGLEISSALHAVNNLTIFIGILFTFMSSSDSISSMGFVVSIALLLVPACIILALNKKFNFVSCDGN